MNRIAFYDTKSYDTHWFDEFAPEMDISIKYIENKLSADTAVLAAGCRAVVAFVNDTLDKECIKALKDLGVEAIALRCAGYNNVDLGALDDSIRLCRVPAYSPAAVAEHAMALVQTLNRKTHRAYSRTRDHNFSLRGLEGFCLEGRTAGIVGTGRVGRIFARICAGFGMKVLAFDPVSESCPDVEYVSFEELCRRSHIISLHCPLTPETEHIIDKDALELMQPGVYIINTSRGALVDSEALLEAIKSGKVGAAGLDVYEEEADLFFEDVSDHVIRDDVLNMLLSQPNVLVTSHQAFFTTEALQAIAETTLENLRMIFDGKDCPNELKPAK